MSERDARLVATGKLGPWAEPPSPVLWLDGVPCVVPTGDRLPVCAKLEATMTGDGLVTVVRVEAHNGSDSDDAFWFGVPVASVGALSDPALRTLGLWLCRSFGLEVDGE